MEHPDGEASRSGVSDDPATVLLVEDDPEVRSITRRVLESQGYRVLAAPDGAEALALAAEPGRSIDLVITDVVMPNLSGEETVRRLREHQPRVSVLYVSGYADAALERLGPLDARSAFLEKPYTPGLLAERVRDLLERIARE